MKVLIAVDGSETAERAFNWYLENMHRPEYELIIAHSGQQPKLPTFSFTEGASFPSDEIKNIMETNNQKMNSLQNKFQQKCESIKSKYKFLFETSNGSPGEQIVRMAETEECDAIIMGSRGLGLIRRTILGSVSDYVVHHTQIPVLVCPQ